MDNKVAQNMIVFILVGIAVILLAPVAVSFVQNSRDKAAISGAEMTMQVVLNLYFELNTDDVIELPFVVEFEGTKQKVYANNVLLKDAKLKYTGSVPKSGKIIIGDNQKTTAKDLIYSNGYKCSKAPNSSMYCELNSK